MKKTNKFTSSCCHLFMYVSRSFSSTALFFLSLAFMSMLPVNECSICARFLTPFRVDIYIYFLLVRLFVIRWILFCLPTPVYEVGCYSVIHSILHNEKWNFRTVLRQSDMHIFTCKQIELILVCSFSTSSLIHSTDRQTPKRTHTHRVCMSFYMAHTCLHFRCAPKINYISAAWFSLDSHCVRWFAFNSIDILWMRKCYWIRPHWM